MKTHLIALASIVSILTLAGCKKSPSVEQASNSSPSEPPAAARSDLPSAPPFAGGPRTSFQEVTSQLDPGGSLFAYLSTDQLLSHLATNISSFRQLALSMPGQPPGDRAKINGAFDLITRLVQTSGVQDVTGVGISAAPVAAGLFRNKLILHHATGAGKGFLWSMFGRAPHSLSAEDMLPANTAIAAFGDLDLKQLWEVVQRELAQSGIPEAAEAARSFPQIFEQQTQINWEQLLASLGGELGIILTLDEANKASFPGGPGGAVEIPSPGLVLAVKVNNSFLYDQICAKLQLNPKTTVTEEGKLKICSMPIPLPLPIPLELTAANSGDYFYFASSAALVRTVEVVRRGKSPGLKSSREFQDLASHLPKEGNQFVYVGEAFGRAIRDLQQQFMQAAMPAATTPLFQQLMGGSIVHSLAVGAHTSTGWHTTSVGNIDSSAGMMLVPVAGTAIGAGMLLPALAKAKSRAQTVSSVNQMKQLGLAARMFCSDHKDKFPNAQTWCDDLKEYAGGNTKIYKAANDTGPGQCSFAYNDKLNGLDQTKVNPQTVLFFEAESGWNRSGGPELMLSAPRSDGTFVVGFADGSVQQMNASRLVSLRWDP